MFFISGMSGLIPVMAVFYPALLPILGGIPCILFFTKTQEFGLVTIMGALLGLITFLMGYGPYAIATGVGCGLIADLVLKAGKYQSWKHMLGAYCIFSEWAVSALLKNYMIPIVMLVVAVGAVLGAYLGKATLKKHFKRAGIA